jgi:hypothetical protein
MGDDTMFNLGYDQTDFQSSTIHHDGQTNTVAMTRQDLSEMPMSQGSLMETTTHVQSERPRRS